jgi:Leucine-rich repeat (LRR) protein
MKWADDNGVSRKRMPRYDEKTLLNISELDLSLLELQSLPKEICNLAKLKKLNVSNNNLKSLPEEIVVLKLKQLDLRGNSTLELNAKQKAWIKEIKEFYSDDFK